jgi:hypothetical protein
VILALALTEVGMTDGVMTIALLAVITLGLLRQQRWGWWVALVMRFFWLLGAVSILIMDARRSVSRRRHSRP